MKVYALLSVLVLGLVLGVRGVTFDCSSLMPVDEGLTNASTSPPFGFAIEPSSVQPGGIVQVTLYSTQNDLPFTSFVVAAHDMSEGPTPMGRWSVESNDGLLQTQDCQGSTAAVLRQGSYDPKVRIVANWTAPASLPTRFQFMATVSISNLTFWDHINSIEVRGIVPVVEAPEVVMRDGEEDFHSDLKESQQAAAAEMKKQEMIDEEVRDSEGDWQKAEVEAEEEHQRMMQWELQQYELQVEQEEHRRQESIRLEILDQEEHAGEMAEEEREDIEEELEEEVDDIIGNGDGILGDENVIDLGHFIGDSGVGSSYQVASFITIFAAVVLAAIL